MGYLEGFRVTFGKLFKGTETGRTVTSTTIADGGGRDHLVIVEVATDRP